MRRQQWGLCALALAILVLGVVALGVPASTLLVAALVLVCPLLMLFRMSGTHGASSQSTEHWAENDREFTIDRR